MNKTKIVISTGLPDLAEPHFDDEATIVSARQVVPIAHARAAERKRRVFSISLILSGAAAFGAFGAIAANYYVQHRPVAGVATQRSENQQPQANSPAVTQTQSSVPLNSKAEPPSGGISAVDSASLSAEQEPKERATSPSEASSSSTPADSTVPSVPAKPANPSDSDAATDPSRLVRKRRVHPVNPTAIIIRTRADKAGEEKRGAGSIEEIFEGPKRP
jgi:hypothetical protein